MECIYYKDLDRNTHAFEPNKDEAKHLKALHVKDGDSILITNTNGLMAKAQCLRTGKNIFSLKILEFLEDFGERNHKLAMAMGILDRKERLEFAIEKAVELGVRDIYLINSDFVQRSKVNLDRLNLKSIAAVKQCKRAFAPNIRVIESVKELLQNSDDYKKIILADVDGQNPATSSDSCSIMTLIGPEGGFSEQELELIGNDNRLETWNLGERRLRAETAAISILGIVSALIK